jgi:hypothetical protein
MALTKITGEGLGSLGTGNLTHGSDSGDTRFTLNSANQYTLVLKNAGNIAGQIGGSGSDVLRFSNAAGATIMEMNAGQITKPLQPAFLATASINQNNFGVGSDVTVNFGTEVFDQNADYNGTTTFTAPVTGKYHLSTSVGLLNIDSASTYYLIKIITSNRTYLKIIDPDFGQDNAYFSMCLTVVADMDASDTAAVKVVQGSGATQTDIEGNGSYTNFSGALLC